MGLVIDEWHRFRMLVGGVVVGVGIGTTYGFSLFTEYMKMKYGFTQADITKISTVGNVIANCAIFMGMLLDYASPKVQLMCSGSIAALGLLLFGLCFDDKIYAADRSTMVVYFSVFSAFLFFGCPSMDGGTILPIMMNFPLNRGHIVMIQKTFCGLGTSILMIYFKAWFHSDDPSDGHQYASYSYFLAVQVVVCAAVGALFIDFPAYSPCEFRRSRMSPEELAEAQATLRVYMRQRTPVRRLYLGCTLVVVQLVLLMTISIYGAFAYISLTGYRVLWAIVIMIIVAFTTLLAPLKFLGAFPVMDGPSAFPGMGEVADEADGGVMALEAGGEREGRRADHEPASGDVDEEQMEEVAVSGPIAKTRRLSADGAPIKEGDENDTSSGVLPVLTASGDPQYTGSFWSHLLTVDLWLMWLGFLGMMGTGLVLVFNSAQIYRSKNYGHYVPSHQALYVALIGTGSACGSLASGLIDTFVSRRRARGKLNVYTTLFYPVGSFLLALSYCFFAIIPAEGIVLPFFIGAMGNGMGWALGALCCRIMYVEDIGKHYNFLWTSGLVAIIGLNRFMFGNMFDSEAEKAGTSPFCDSPKCINRQMWILCGVNVLATCGALGMHLRFARFANRELAQRAEVNTANAAIDAPPTNDTAASEELSSRDDAPFLPECSRPSHASDWADGRQFLCAIVQTRCATYSLITNTITQLIVRFLFYCNRLAVERTEYLPMRLDDVFLIHPFGFSFHLISYKLKFHVELQEIRDVKEKG
eukprot:gene4007-2862_t